MSLVFLFPWAFLLYFSYHLKSIFVFYFVFFQFVFVGFGLSVFPFLGFDYLKKSFPAFELAKLEASDFNLASVSVLLGVASVVIFYASMRFVSSVGVNNFIESRTQAKPFAMTRTKNIFIFFLGIASFFICAPFVFGNYGDLIGVFLADSVSGLSSAVEARSGATSNYIVILFVYNILPALSLLSCLSVLEKASIKRWLMFWLYFFMTSASLLVTYQKRPLLVFLGSLVLAPCLYKMYSRGLRRSHIDFYDLIYSLKWKILSIILILILFYYFYTGLRFSYDVLELVCALFGIVFLRIFGRLSVPAAMYVNYFPDIHDFYGLNNVGLLAKIFGNQTYLDSKETFIYYSNVGIDGSLAASSFIDSYGQGGIAFSILYGFIISFIIIALDNFAFRSKTYTSKTFLTISGFIFLYYLSQASVFRSMLGYGGIFYFLLWVLFFKIKLTSTGR